MNTDVIFQLATLVLMAVFYVAYFAKQISQRRQGVSTMILGKGDKPSGQKRVESLLKAATFGMPAVEIASIWLNRMPVPLWLRVAGMAVAATGVAFFIAGMLTMKGSWRAGIPEKRETALVKEGIYRISRNPAFVGFDLMYVGILAMFPNLWHLAAVILTVLLFHRQILGEERFLESAFGEEYLAYRRNVRRYL